MCRTFDYENCTICEHRSDTCKEHCSEYKLHKLAYVRAAEIFNDNSISIPKSDCKGCKDRHTMCHDGCWTYMIYIEYRKLVKESIKKQKAVESINHLVGIPGLPKGAVYTKSKHNKYVYPN